MVTKAAIYARQSMDKTEGIDRQLEACRARAKAEGWEVVAEYEDNYVSAYKERGSGTSWHQMLLAFERGEFTHLLATDTTRVLRNVKDILMLMDIGLRLVTLNGSIDLITSDGRMAATQQALYAQFEADKKSDRQKVANAYRVQRGRPVPGRRRFGYETDGITPRKEEAQTVKWMFEQTAKGKSLRGISKSLALEGVKTTTGRDWTPVRVRETLTNLCYIGTIVHSGIRYDDTLIKPIVEKQLFEKVGAVLADPSRKKSPGGARRHVASGIAKCGVCGTPLVFRNGYMCLQDLSHPLIRKDYMETRIAEEIFLWIAEHPELEATEEIEGDSPKVLKMLADLEKATVARSKYSELFAEGLGDSADLKRKIGLKDGEVADLTDSIRNARGVAARNEMVDTVRSQWWARRHIREYTEREHKALKDWMLYWEGLDLEKKREVVKATLDITLNKGLGAERIGAARIRVVWKSNNAKPAAAKKSQAGKSGVAKATREKSHKSTKP
jgi:site-specific DNA recombinase